MSLDSHSPGSGLPASPGPGALDDERFFRAAVDWELQRADRYWESFIIALLETEKPLTGALGSKLKSCLRQCDLAARTAGDRFALLCIRTGTEFLPGLRKRLVKAIEKTGQGPGDLFIGAAVYPVDGTSADTLLASAAEALQKARTEGRDGIYFFPHARPSTDSRRPRILVVDDDPQNRKLLRMFLATQDYDVAEAGSGQEALGIIRAEDVDLVLLDVMMPGMNGFDVCQRLKGQESTQGLPVILVTALDDTESKVKGIEAGADDFIAKPINFEELSARTASLVRLKKINSSMTSVENVLLSLAAAVEAKDAYTQGHTDRAARLAMNLGRQLCLSATEIHCLRIGGILHDVGKIGVPESILNKEGPLTAEEWQVMKTHPEVGFRICESLGRTLGEALEVIRHHHEKLDGSSYPDGLKGEQISMASRIMAVVDIYDALITDRPYRKAMPAPQAFAILKKEAAEGKLDQSVVDALIHEVQKG
jgi:putative two-component system response regulator